MVFFEPGVDFCLKLADTHGSYQIIKALRLQGSNHSLHARLDLRCPWPCPQLGYILVSQPQLGLPLIRLLSKALTPLFDRLFHSNTGFGLRVSYLFLGINITEQGQQRQDKAGGWHPVTHHAVDGGGPLVDRYRGIAGCRLKEWHICYHRASWIHHHGIA